MKRQPLSSTSLKDILELDKATEEAENKSTHISTQNTNAPDNKKDKRNRKSEIINKKTEIGDNIKESVRSSSDIVYKSLEARNQNSENVNSLRKDKADFQKISFTLDPKMLWLLEDERRRRRVAKVDYSFSEIIREALEDFFIKLNRKAS